MEIFKYFFGYNEIVYLLKGVNVTLQLWAIAFFFGLIIGAFIGIAKSNHKIKLFSWIATVYIEVFRSIPLMVQMMVGYFGVALIGLDIDLPRFGVAASVLSFYAGAYLGEIFRSGIESVHKNQWEAACGLGFNYFQCLRYIVIPQSLQVIIPSIIGFSIGLLKGTSMCVVIGIIDLAGAARRIAERHPVPLPMMIGSALIYFALTYPLAKLGTKIEKKFRITKGTTLT